MLLTYVNELSNKYKEEISKSEFPDNCTNLSNKLRQLADEIDAMVNSDTAQGIVQGRANIIKLFAKNYEALYMVWMKYNISTKEVDEVRKHFNVSVENDSNNEINFDEMEF